MKVFTSRDTQRYTLTCQENNQENNQENDQVRLVLLPRPAEVVSDLLSNHRRVMVYVIIYGRGEGQGRW